MRRSFDIDANFSGCPQRGRDAPATDGGTPTLLRVGATLDQTRPAWCTSILSARADFGRERTRGAPCKFLLQLFEGAVGLVRGERTGRAGTSAAARQGQVRAERSVFC